MEEVTLANVKDSAATRTSAIAAEQAVGIRNAVVSLALFLVALSSLVGLQQRLGVQTTGISNAPHFIYQAESLLHGHWSLDMPARVVDIITLHGKHYIVYPPFPAILLMPFVAIFGLRTSDVLFTTVVAASNLSLLYLLFEQVRANGLTRRSWYENAFIALLLYYGSINLWLSLGGRMWFTAHIVCMAFTLLSLLVAFRRHYTWAALLLGAAFFSRATVVVGFVFLFYLAWQDAGRQHLVERFTQSLRQRHPDWSAVPWRRLVPVALATVAVGALYLLHNAVIFGSPFETGYDILIQQRYPEVTGGAFNIRYVPANIIAYFFTFPRVIFQGPFDRHPALDMLNNGVAVSLWVTTPLFLLLFRRNQRFSLLRAMLWVTIGVAMAYLLLFHAAGYFQFGTRYLYDIYPYAFLLLVLSEVRVDWRFALLGLVAIPINLLGAHQFWTLRIVHL